MTGSTSTTQLAWAAGAGVVAGLAANVFRKAVVQGPTALAGNWADALAAEHRATIAIMDRLERTNETQVARRTLLLAQLRHALARHAFQEENVVYPMLRDNGLLEDADHLTADHGYVKQYLHDLDTLPKSSPAWIFRVHDFRALLVKHMAEEEQEIFPMLAEQLTDQESRQITLAMNREGLKLA